LRREAENLIATKVEPVVREANRHAKDLIDRKWRKLMTGVAKAFGLAGAGWIDPKLLVKAVQQSLETTALAFGDVEDRSPLPKETSHFVLEARSFILKQGY
jgi:hypothetical protein